MMQIQHFLFGFGWPIRFFYQKFDVGLKEGTLLQDLKHLESTCTLGDDIQPEVFIPLYDGYYFCGATDLSDAMLDGTDYPERRVAVEALADHLLVSRLKDVQRQSHSRKEN